MKNSRLTPLFLLFFCLFSSCLKNVDFEQVEDFSTYPIVKSTLVYFTLNQISFFDTINSAEITSPLNNTSDFISLKSTFMRNNLLRAEFDFVIANQFNRSFTVDIEFLNENDIVTYRFDTFYIAANNLNFTRTLGLKIADNLYFLSSTKIKVSVRLTSDSGTPINPNIEQKLVFKSSGTYFLKT